MTRPFDCIVCGSCVVDILCRPASLTAPIGQGVLHHVDPLLLRAGGITSNSGVTMARMGLSVGVFTRVGKDDWAPVIRGLYKSEGIDTTYLSEDPEGATSTTVVMIDSTGERSFFHCVGATKRMSAKDYLSNLDLFARSKYALIGYYSMMPLLTADLARVLKEIRATGCKTAMDAAGQGGTMDPLKDCLPHLDVWVPSHLEAKNQTGHEDPEKIVQTYRNAGGQGLLGVKLGRQGVLLSPKPGEFIRIPIATPPGPVVDATGAGDSFYAGLLTGLIKGLTVEQAGKLGTASGACCVTSLGGASGGRDYAFTSKLAGIS
jgi:sugar/nucleoside kinase (ribokinase family)